MNKHLLRILPIAASLAAALLAMHGAQAAEWGVGALVRAGIATHPSIGATQAEQRATEAQVDAAKWQYYPSPSVQTDHLDGQHATVFRLSQTIWDGGKLSADLDGARLRAARAGLGVAEAQFALGSRIVDLYQNYLVQAARQEIQLRGVRKLEELANMISRRSDSGVSARIDVDLANARLAQARSELSAIEYGQRVVLGQLVRATGVDLKQTDVRREEIAQGGGNLKDLLNLAMQQNPSVQRAAVDTRIAQNDVRQVNAGKLPTLSLRAEHQAGTYPGSAASGNRLVVSLNYAPGAGLAVYSQAAAAESRAESTDLSDQSARRDLSDRIEAAWQELNSSLGRLPELTQTSRSSAEVLESSQRLFTTGRRSWLDLLNAVRELMQAEQTESDTRATAVGAAYRLRLLTGDPVWIEKGASHE